MNHYTSPAFWAAYEVLPVAIQRLADKNYELLKSDRHHPSLHLKRVGTYWSVRVTREWRALGVPVDDGILWFWIGPHEAYDRLIR